MKAKTKPCRNVVRCHNYKLRHATTERLAKQLQGDMRVSLRVARLNAKKMLQGSLIAA